MEPVVNESTSTKPKSVERIVIGSSESEKLKQWIADIETSVGFMSLSKSDLVNYLIHSHCERFSAKEIQRLKLRFYDPLKHMRWITERLKVALSANDVAQVAKLQAQIKSVELSLQPGTQEPKQKIRTPRKKKDPQSKGSPDAESTVEACPTAFGSSE